MPGQKLKRRHFVKTALASSAMACLPGLIPAAHSPMDKIVRTGGPRLKLSLNAYSFNNQLRDSEMDLFGLLDYCAENGYDAVDPTGYYFPGYPQVPADSYLFGFKRRASILGLDISGTGVRNNFSNPDKASRKRDIKHVAEWIQVASKLGVPLLRVFPGKEHSGIAPKKVAMQWVIDAMKECTEIGQKNGVMIAMQNHDEFLKNSDEITEVIESVNSPWFGLYLDIGSFSEKDPYEEIGKLVKYAINWQIKELVWENGQKVPADYDRIVEIMKKAGYRGYLPLETLQGDPYEQLPLLKQKVLKAIG